MDLTTTMDRLQDPTDEELKSTYEQFLISLTGPTIIDITGIDTSRTRVLVTLLHGNEPSGFIGLHRWLKEYNQSDSHLLTPETNIRFIICSTEAAKSLPLFTKRYVVGGYDLNRCFGSSVKHTADKSKYIDRARMIEEAIREVSPEAVVDLHNTSGLGPAFAVSQDSNEALFSLTSLFCSTMILSHMNLGALMEQDFNCPNLTIECGGSTDKQAHELAYNGISLYCSYQDLSECHYNNPVEIIHTPLRLQVKQGVTISFATENTDEQGIIFRADLEKLNFGVTPRGEKFGWINNSGLESLELVDEHCDDVITDYFTVLNNELICATNIRVFMATPNLEIAKSDCVFYVIKQRDIKATQLLDVDYIPS